MSFENNGAFSHNFNQQPRMPTLANLSHIPNVPRPAPKLNDPMIGRVHKAKAGCSACGKKVA